LRAGSLLLFSLHPGVDRDLVLAHRFHPDDRGSFYMYVWATGGIAADPHRGPDTVIQRIPHRGATFEL
jgi:hypothetical protein